MSIRPVKRLIKAKPTLEGAGVHLRRAFGFGNTSDFDPFLLLDDFRNDDPGGLPRRLPVASAPRHRDHHLRPRRHRRARRQHGQPRRHRRRRRPVDDRRQRHHPPGDAARATRQGRMHGFQLWANLPASLKMTAPRYQEVKAPDIPEVTDDDGTQVRVVCGSFWGKTGPVDGIAAEPIYLDVSVPPGTQEDPARRDHPPRLRLRLRGRRQVLQRLRPARRADRRGRLGRHRAPAPKRGQPLAGRLRPRRRGHRAGRRATASASCSSPASRSQEPVAWYGPIVMNTQEQLQQAFEELKEGTFLRG